MYLYNSYFDDSVMYHTPHPGELSTYDINSYSDDRQGSVMKSPLCDKGLLDYECRMQEVNRDIQDNLHMSRQPHVSQPMEVAIPGDQVAQMYGHPPGLYDTCTSLHSPNGIAEISQSGSPPPPPRMYKPCVVCNDRSSGYHYGVSSCEGCKGFFRRSVQKNMQYTCHKEKNCVINKVTRNRCQFCRLQKCFTKGMSKDAVRNDRNKKRKAKVDSCASSSHSSDDLTEDELNLISLLEQAHSDTFPLECNDERYNFLQQKYSGMSVEDHINNKISVKQEHPLPVHTQATLEDAKEMVLWGRIYELSTAGIVCIVDFAKRVPGFLTLSSSDQITLLKSACLEIMILRLSSRYNNNDETITFSNGLSLNRDQLREGGFGSLTDTIFNFAVSMRNLNIDETECALLSAICLISGDRSGLECSEQIEAMQEPILAALNHYVRQQHPRQSHIFAKVLMKLTDLRSISVKGAKTVLSMQSEMSPLIREILDRTENVTLPPISSIKEECLTQL